MQYLGRVLLRLNGQPLYSEKGAKLTLGGVKREPINLQYAFGYSEDGEPAKVECTTALAKGMSLQTLRTSVDAVLQFECDTGQIYVINNAYLTESPEISSDKGKVTLKFSGDPAEEMM